MAVCWLGEAGCGDPARVGGKAASLSRFARRYDVPPGFCLVPPVAGDARDELTQQYARLAALTARADPPVAVRSSAADEDSGEASFAGQHETFLNVVGPDAVAEAVAACWASAHTERAASYRTSRGLPPPRDRIPVLVQALVAADTSGVVFTVNPVTGDRDEIVVDVSWGLGESVVAGAVTPDHFVLRRDDLAIGERRVADKERMTVPAAHGTAEVDVPWALRRRPAIDDAQAQAMARLALELERETARPVDVECCWAAERLWLLQCRPVTTLKPDEERSAAWQPTSST